jgi:hypothetical protein
LQPAPVQRGGPRGLWAIADRVAAHPPQTVETRVRVGANASRCLSAP